MKRTLLITASALCALLGGCAGPGVRSEPARAVARAAAPVTAHHSHAAAFRARAPLPIATARIRETIETACAARDATPARPEDASELVNAFDDVLGGSATIAVYVDAHGRPIAEDVRSYSDDGFRQAASQMLAAWPFVPARCDGRPVAGRYIVRFNA